jgi:hypothetical protein
MSFLLKYKKYHNKNKKQNGGFYLDDITPFSAKNGTLPSKK